METTTRPTGRTGGGVPTFRAGLAVVIGTAILGVLVAGCGGTDTALPSRSTTTTAAPKVGQSFGNGSATSTPASPTSAESQDPPPSIPPVAASSTHGPLTSPPLPPPAAEFDPGHVTAVGDSVMLDYATTLEADIPGVDVQAAVSRQWSTGETLLAQAKAAGLLGAVVIVGLGTNGPITQTDFTSMMSILAGASRVVFVNVYVDRPWQDPNNAVLAAGVAGYPNAVLADWNGLASQNPGWLYQTGTHLPINGQGAQALAALIAADV